MRRFALPIALIAALLALTLVNIRLMQDRHVPSQPPTALTTDTFAAIAHRTLPKTVTIHITGKVTGFAPLGPRGRLLPDDLLRRFERFRPDGDEEADPESEEERWSFHGRVEPDELRIVDAAGSGVIVRSDGHIVTNHHLVANMEDLEFEVQLYDGRVFSGEDVVLVATDELTDLAVIRVNAEGLDAVEFGDSDLVNIGDWVIAVGNPLQLAHTVTQGIVSSKYRETSQGMIVDFLQTSAHIEPGSSGGALLNLRGELVGINTAIATEGDRWEGFGFALPSNTVHTVVDSLIEKGHVPRGYIGIRFPNAGGGLSESARRLLGYRGPGGVLIQGVESSGPSDFAGIQPDDILVTLAGQPIATGLDMLRTVASLPVGSIAEVELWRGDRRTSTGRFVTADLAIAARPSDDELRLRDRRVPPEPSDEPVTLGRTGLSVNITGPLSDRQIMVTGVDPNTPADQLGFQVGDRIVRVNGWRVGTEWGLYDALRLQPAHIADHEFLIRRGDIDRRLVMSVEEAGLEPAPDIAEPPPPARGAPREQTD